MNNYYTPVYFKIIFHPLVKKKVPSELKTFFKKEGMPNMFL